nr:homoserine O-acetyltransferase [Salirhabdus euzebyi]
MLEKNIVQEKHISGTVSIGSLCLESGEIIENAVLAFERVGPLNAPVVLVCHALTGDQFAVGTEEKPGWWRGLIGANQAVDTEQFQVITFNILGGCNGSTGPLAVNKNTSKPYRSTFPHVTVRDMVNAQRKALNQLGIDHLYAVMGGSLGGMQVLEWGIMYPKDMKKLFVFAATPFLTDYGIAFNRIGIEAIENDPNWKQGEYSSAQDIKGFEIARMIGMITYRSPSLFTERFARTKCHQNGKNPLYEVESYLRHQGEKLTSRFDANSYLTLLYTMNGHDIGRNRNGWESASNLYEAEIIAFSYENDLIYTPELMSTFVSKVSKSHYYRIPTKFGHDGFLVEFNKWGYFVKEHLEN